MVVVQSKSRRKQSGARYVSSRKKRQFEKGSNPTHSKVGAVKSREDRTVGGNAKIRLLSVNIANVYDPKSKKFTQSKIVSVVENPANRHYVRRNILTKGTVVATEKGNAKITSRPGQESMVNAILI